MAASSTHSSTFNLGRHIARSEGSGTVKDPGSGELFRGPHPLRLEWEKWLPVLKQGAPSVVVLHKRLVWVVLGVMVCG